MTLGQLLLIGCETAFTKTPWAGQPRHFGMFIGLGASDHDGITAITGKASLF